MRILFVEDDPKLQRETAHFLEAHQHEVTVCGSVPEGLAYAEQHEPDLLLCDYRLEGGPNGLVLAKQVRNLYKDCVIVMISAYAETDHVIEALLLDLDHYVRRPITLEALHDELWKAVDLHHQKHPPTSPILTAGALVLDTDSDEATWHGEPLDLSPREGRLLAALVVAPGRVVSMVDLWAVVGAERVTPAHAADLLRLYLHRLRHKLTQGGKYPWPIVNVRGKGYRWSEEG
jgi:DNA-binding response OmpR family regulator